MTTPSTDNENDGRPPRVDITLNNDNDNGHNDDNNNNINNMNNDIPHYQQGPTEITPNFGVNDVIANDNNTMKNPINDNNNNNNGTAHAEGRGQPYKPPTRVSRSNDPGLSLPPRGVGSFQPSIPQQIISMKSVGGSSGISGASSISALSEGVDVVPPLWSPPQQLQQQQDPSQQQQQQQQQPPQSQPQQQQQQPGEIHWNGQDDGGETGPTPLPSSATPPSQTIGNSNRDIVVSLTGLSDNAEIDVNFGGQPTPASAFVSSPVFNPHTSITNSFGPTSGSGIVDVGRRGTFRDSEATIPFSNVTSGRGNLRDSTATILASNATTPTTAAGTRYRTRDIGFQPPAPIFRGVTAAPTQGSMTPHQLEVFVEHEQLPQNEQQQQQQQQQEYSFSTGLLPPPPPPPPPHESKENFKVDGIYIATSSSTDHAVGYDEEGRPFVMLDVPEGQGEESNTPPKDELPVVDLPFLERGLKPRPPSPPPNKHQTREVQPWEQPPGAMGRIEAEELYLNVNSRGIPTQKEVGWKTWFCRTVFLIIVLLVVVWSVLFVRGSGSDDDDNSGPAPLVTPVLLETSDPSPEPSPMPPTNPSPSPNPTPILPTTTVPTTFSPTSRPTSRPTSSPTAVVAETTSPTGIPTSNPTVMATTNSPTMSPAPSQTNATPVPTEIETNSPSSQPTTLPSQSPTMVGSLQPSVSPTTSTPTSTPTSAPTDILTTDFEPLPPITGTDTTNGVRFGTMVSLDPDGQFLAASSASGSRPIEIFTVLEDSNGELGLQPHSTLLVDGPSGTLESPPSFSLTTLDDGTPVLAVASSHSFQVYRYDSPNEIWTNFGQEAILWLSSNNIIIGGDDQQEEQEPEVDNNVISSAIDISYDGLTVAASSLSAESSTIITRVIHFNADTGIWDVVGTPIYVSTTTTTTETNIRPSFLRNSVSISGNGRVVSIGGWLISNPASYVESYEWDGTEWVRRLVQGIVVEDDENDVDDQLTYVWGPPSHALSENGNRMVISIPTPGNTMIYDWDGLHWIPATVVDTENDNTGTGTSTSTSSVLLRLRGGSDVSITRGGGRIMVGSPLSGQVLTHDLVHNVDDDDNNNNNVWRTNLPPLQGTSSTTTTTTSSTRFGSTVAMSSNGNILAVGSPLDGSNGPNTGRVYLFQ